MTEEAAVCNLGEIAYNAYGDAREWRVFDGSPMPAWEDQTEELREAWQAAALAVLETLA